MESTPLECYVKKARELYGLHLVNDSFIGSLINLKVNPEEVRLRREQVDLLQANIDKIINAVKKEVK